MKTMIKKILTILLSVFLVMPFASSIILAEGLYTDSETGITFTIPDGWEAIGLSKEDRQVAKEKFSTGVAGEIFVYLSANLYDQLPDEYKEQLTKDSFDGYRLTDADAKELFNEADGYDSYTTEVIGGEEWYVLKNSLLDYYVQYINGNMIGFTISKVMSEDRIKQVKGIIEEVTKNEVAKEHISSLNNSISSSNTSNDSNFQTPSYSGTSDGAKALAFILLVIIVVCILIWRKKKAPTKTNEDNGVICNVCGEKNDAGSVFCTKCGNKLQ